MAELGMLRRLLRLAESHDPDPRAKRVIPSQARLRALCPLPTSLDRQAVGCAHDILAPSQLAHRDRSLCSSLCHRKTLLGIASTDLHHHVHSESN